MGTNFYLLSTDHDFIYKHFMDGYNKEFELTDEPHLAYQVHLAKTSCGWKPLFQAHKNAYNSVKELLEFLNAHESEISLYDEYDTQYTIPEFIERVVNFNSDCIPKRLKWNTDTSTGVWGFVDAEDNFTGPTITTPFDHIEYFKFEHDYDHTYYNEIIDNHWNDPEGYNFVNGDFS